MAKKNSRSPESASTTRPSAPERRRTPRATTRTTATTPDATIAESNGTPAVALDTANDMSHQDGESTSRTPTYEQIAEAAYLRYLDRGGQHGHDLDDWVAAERSLLRDS